MDEAHEEENGNTTLASVMPCLQQEENACLDLTSFLLDCGAKVSRTNDSKAILLHFARGYHVSPKVVERLTSKDAPTQMQWQNSRGETPPHLAAYCTDGDLEWLLVVAELLLQAGASLNQKDRSVKVALDFATAEIRNHPVLRARLHRWGLDSL